MKNIFFSLIMLAGMTRLMAQASDEDLMKLSLEELMQIEISVGSKTVKNPDQIPGAVIVIDKEQIRALQARTLRDALNVMVPGMDVVPTYFKYGDPVSEGIYSRGILSDFNQQILILFNGENKFNESTFGSPYTGMQFTLENVERIEISTSPAPLMGGSALTTINVITKDAGLMGTEVYLNTGFNSEDGLQSKRFTVNHGQNIDGWHLGTSLQYADDKGQSHPDQDVSDQLGDEAELKDGIRGAISFTANVKSPDEKMEIGSWYKNVEADALFSNLSLSESSDLYGYKASTFHNYIKYAPVDAIELSAGASVFSRVNTFNLDEFIPVGVDQRINVPFRTSLNNYNYYLKLDYLKDFKFLGENTLNAGFKVEREGQYDHSLSQLNDANIFIDVTDQRKRDFNIDLPDDDRTIYSLFGENNWNPKDNLSLLLGFRLDNYQNFQGTSITAFNPRMALAYLPNDNFIIKALYSKAVRPPSSYEIQGNSFLPLLYGNENLTFEELSTYEISVKFRNKGFEVMVNPFFEKFNNRIGYIASELDETIAVASNNGELEVSGVELIMKYTWKEQNYFFLNASRLRSEDQVSGEKSLYIPEAYINGGINLNWDALNVNLSGFYRGEREVEPGMNINAERATDGYFMANLAVSYTLRDAFEVYILTENVLDNEAFIPLSRDGLYVPLRRRTINLGLNVRF
ncbi:TonB-dependent siderophore receptor [Fulvivirga sp. M361]|uniref:TonB-dependent receptor plug domain-containing protein n=1 Tax=Fulvivirga sp. M361 TaxID=2594266 RepID=UPI0016298419|nr:TonB-dependent receptor [Fulvivirga sp. M361]